MPCSFARWPCRPQFSLDAVGYFIFLFPTLSMSSVELYVAGQAGWKFLCPLGKVLTYSNLIYLLNFPFYCVNTST